MRTLKQFFISMLLISSLLLACNKEDEGSYVKPVTLYEHVAGEWSLSELKQIDLTARAASIKPDEFKLTSVLNFNTLALTLAVDTDNNPTSFSVEGTAPVLFPTSGYWKLSTDYLYADGTPVRVLLYSDAAKTKSIGELTLQTVPGVTAELGLVLTRSSNGIAYVSYNYKFVGASN